MVLLPKMVVKWIVIFPILFPIRILIHHVYNGFIIKFSLSLSICLKVLYFESIIFHYFDKLKLYPIKRQVFNTLVRLCNSTPYYQNNLISCNHFGQSQ